MRGQLALHQLPVPVAAFYFAGWNEAKSYADRQAAEYEHQLDQLYIAAYSPKNRAEIQQQRLDHHFARLDTEFFAEPVIVGPAPRSIRESQLHIAERKAA